MKAAWRDFTALPKNWKGRSGRRQAQHQGELGLLEGKGGTKMKRIYLEQSSGDDAACTMEKLKALVAKER